MSRRAVIAANWKMNKTIAEAEEFVSAIVSSDRPSACDLIVIPPFFAVPAVAVALARGKAGVSVGVQDVFWEDSGAYTGEVSAAMVGDAGAEFVLIGHSERRHVIGETNDVVAKKMLAALRSKLTPILCVGETLDEREAGREQDAVDNQLKTAFDGAGDRVDGVIIAYEPVWAIGTGKTATPDDANDMHLFIRQWFGRRFGEEKADALRIQYGGSVRPGNAAELLGREHIDGALVGGASLDPASFLAIAVAVD